MFEPYSKDEIDVYQTWDYPTAPKEHLCTGSAIWCLEKIQEKMIEEWGEEYAP